MLQYRKKRKKVNKRPHKYCNNRLLGVSTELSTVLPLSAPFSFHEELNRTLLSAQLKGKEQTKTNYSNVNIINRLK